MPPRCDLEVLVNHSHTFYVSTGILLPRCGRLVKVFEKVAVKNGGQQTRSVRCYRMILHDFPGGPEAFELLARFCYSGGNLGITTSNVARLRCVAEYLEMTEEYCVDNLFKQTESFLSTMNFWNWENCLGVLKSCEAVLSYAEKARIIQRCVDSLAVKASSWCSSKMSSPLSFHSPDLWDPLLETSSEDKFLHARRNWWCEDMSSLSMYLMERIVKALVANGVDNKQVGKFLVRYLEASLPLLGYSSLCISRTGKPGPDEEILHEYTQTVQREVLETVVSLLYSLDRASVPAKSLFGLRRVAIALNASKHCRKQLEEMIGLQLDKASLDNMLIPRMTSPSRSTCLYDVDLVLRLLKVFVQSDPLPSLRTVGNLMDMYLAEVAPDPHLKASKFRELAEALPNNSRDSHDGLYRALDIYLEAHPRTSSNEAREIFQVLDFEKLSFEASRHLMENPRVPTKVGFQVLSWQQAKLRAVLDCCFKGELSRHCLKETSAEDGNGQQMVVYSPTLDYTDLMRQNEELKADLQTMQQRVMHLEGVCRSLRCQISKHLRFSR